jgi:hypothetical protein
MRAHFLALAACAALASCSPKGAVFLYIEGQRNQQPLKVPEEVDRVALQITPAGDPAKLLLDRSWTLSQEQFPLTLGLEPGEETPDRVRLAVTLSKADAPLGAAEAQASFPPGEVNTLTIRVQID